jgi:hypothetical protein
MDASDVTRRIRQIALIKGPSMQYESYDDYLVKQSGQATGICCLNEPVQIEVTVRTGLTSLLDYAATSNRGPTRCARLLYLWFNGVTSTYEWANAQPALSHIDRCIWMIYALIHITDVVTPAADTGPLEAFIHNYDGSAIQERGNWSTWSTTWGQWLQDRASDGSVAAEAQPSPLPNGPTTALDVATTTGAAINAYPNKHQWTPLKIGTKPKQPYLTYGWGNVASAVLTPTQEATVLAAAGPLLDETARKAEIDVLLGVTDNLDDTEKVTAEFWAGGVGTYSPPGILMWLWKDFTESMGTPATAVIQSGYELATRLFETSRLVWNLKALHMQSRPIQDVRRFYPGTRDAWVPYQEATFVTPPFADFPSGHSAFSQSFARIMTRWFGAQIPVTAARPMTGLSRISPMLADAQTVAFGTFVVPAASSMVDGTVPAAPITLSWSTWQEMAESAGISRQYGGIHALSAHTASQALANALDAILTN